jgi:hypothetical protein
MRNKGMARKGFSYKFAGIKIKSDKFTEYGYYC